MKLVCHYKSDFTVHNCHFGSKKNTHRNRYLLFLYAFVYVPQKEGGDVVNLPVRAPLAPHLVQLVEDVLAELGVLLGRCSVQSILWVGLSAMVR